MNCGICNQEMEHINDIGLRCMNCDLDQEPIKIELTYKRESKELETALAVVRCLINDSKNCIKANEDDKHMKKQSCSGKKKTDIRDEHEI